MTDKEKLEVIKSYLEEITQMDETHTPKLRWIMDNAELLLHVIEQAESLDNIKGWYATSFNKVIELEVFAQQQMADVISLSKENKRYREALEFYADEKTHKNTYQYTSSGERVYVGEPRINNDKGSKARQALEQST